MILYKIKPVLSWKLFSVFNGFCWIRILSIWCGSGSSPTFVKDPDTEKWYRVLQIILLKLYLYCCLFSLRVDRAVRFPKTSSLYETPTSPTLEGSDWSDPIPKPLTACIPPPLPCPSHIITLGTVYQRVIASAVTFLSVLALKLYCI